MGEQLTAHSGGAGTVRLDERSLKEGLMGLVVALVEIIREVLELEAVRQIEAGSIGADAAERLADALADMSDALERMKDEYGLRDAADKVRQSLDQIVQGAFQPRSGFKSPRDML